MYFTTHETQRSEGRVHLPCRYMQAATLNSLVRALAPSSAARALRMVSFMTTLGLPTYHLTTIALVGACARHHLSAEASDLYWWACRTHMPGALCLSCCCMQIVTGCLPGPSCTSSFSAIVICSSRNGRLAEAGC